MDSEKIRHAFGDDILADHDGVALAGLIKSGQVHAAEVVDAAVARARRIDPGLNAIAEERFAQARCDAEEASDGFFAGVPTFIKDNTSFAGTTTNHGSAAVRSRPAAESGDYAKQYMSLGFVCLGKSAMPEFGLNATTEPAGGEPTRNPWHIEHSCGGSSGGSAECSAGALTGCPALFSGSGRAATRMRACSTSSTSCSLRWSPIPRRSWAT